MADIGKLIEALGLTDEEYLGYVQSIPDPDPYIGANFLPEDQTTSLDFVYDIFESNRTMAYLVGWDTEAPLKGRPAIQRVSAEIAPVKHKVHFGEKELLKLQKPRQGMDEMEEVRRYFLDLTDNLVLGIRDRFEWFRWQALARGELTYNHKDVTVTVDFGVPEDHKINDPSELEGNTAWTDANADILEDLEDMVETYRHNNKGRKPDRIVTSSKIISLMLKNQGIKNAVFGHSSAQVVVTRPQLEELLISSSLPPVQEYDVEVADENSQGNRGDWERLIPEGRIVLLSEFTPQTRVGWLKVGPTVENGFNSGLWAGAYSEQDPPSQFVMAAATAFPMVVEASTIMYADVYNPS